jgi:hypothetical protein
VTIIGPLARTIPYVVDVRPDAPTIVEWLGAIGGSVVNQAAALPGAGPLVHLLRGREPGPTEETRADASIRILTPTPKARSWANPHRCRRGRGAASRSRRDDVDSPVLIDGQPAGGVQPVETTADVGEVGAESASHLLQIDHRGVLRVTAGS